jgi:hypothetical protein
MDYVPSLGVRLSVQNLGSWFQKMMYRKFWGKSHHQMICFLLFVLRAEVWFDFFFGRLLGSETGRGFQFGCIICFLLHVLGIHFWKAHVFVEFMFVGVFGWDSLRNLWKLKTILNFFFNYIWLWL